MRFSISLALFVLVWCGCGDAPATDGPPTIDGYTYKTVKIGDQEWFAENLRTTVYANGDEIQYYRGATVKCRHILLKTDDINDDAQLATLEARADSLKRRLRAGDEFADLVNKHSEDPGSKATGGEYEFQRGLMVRPFEDFCFGNRVGTVGTAKTNYGLHLIEVLDQQLNNCNSVEAQELGIRCSHHHADSMNVKYGQLYNWYVVDDERGLCPSGWHVPTLREWKNLEDYIVSQGHSGRRGRRALMSMTGWLEKFGEGSGTDDFGFSGLPGGSYSYNLYEETVEFDGANDDYGDYGCWWSSSTESGDNWSVQLPVHSQGRSLLKKQLLRSCTGASVRCLKDTE